MAERKSLAKRLFGRTAVEQRSEPLTGVVPPAYTNAQPVTVKSALSISAIYGAVNILTTWVSQMDVEVHRAGEVIAAPTLIAQPDTDSTQFSFIKQTVTSLALDGNAFWLVSFRQSDGTPVNVKVLNPFAVKVERTEGGKYLYHYTHGKGTTTYTARQVRHISTTQIPGRLRGLGVIEANNAGIAAALELRAYADNWFNSAGVPKGGYLKSDQELDTDQLREARMRWLEQMNDGLPPAMGQGFNYESVNLNPADAMFLEQQQFAITEIARWFGIPAGLMLADSGATGLTYQNLQTDARLFVTNTLMSYMLPIQEAFSALLPRGTTVKFATESLLRGDTQQRYEAYSTASGAQAWMTVNEIRELEGKQPVAGGDVLPIQTKETSTEAIE